MVDKQHKCHICKNELENPKREIRDVFFDKDLNMMIQKVICDDCMVFYNNYINNDGISKDKYYEFRRKYKKDILELSYYNEELESYEQNNIRLNENIEKEYHEELNNGIDLSMVLRSRGG